MNLYLLEPTVRTDAVFGYDCAVVVAATARQAAMIHPLFGLHWDGEEAGGWVKQGDVSVEFLGTAEDTLIAGTTICAG